MTPDTRRIPTRVMPIGVKDGPTILIAVCSDGTFWELDRRARWQDGNGIEGAADWQQLPSIPNDDGTR